MPNDKPTIETDIVQRGGMDDAILRGMASYQYAQPELSNTQGSTQSRSFYTPTQHILINLFTVIFGVGVGAGSRVGLSAWAHEDGDQAVITHNNGTEMRMTDFLGCMVMLGMLIYCYDYRPYRARTRLHTAEREIRNNRLCSSVTLFRQTIRNGTAIFLGVVAMFLLKVVFESLGERDTRVSGLHGERVFEVSDVLGGIVLAFIFHLLEFVANRFISSDPRRGFHMSDLGGVMEAGGLPDDVINVNDDSSGAPTPTTPMLSSRSSGR